MSTDAYIEMVYRNLKGELSPEAFAELNALTAKDEKLAQLRIEIEDAWDVAGDLPQIVIKADTERLSDRLLKQEKKNKTFTLGRVVSGVAAILVLAFGAMWLMQDKTTVYTQAGEILLADNTKVELREGSTLEVGKFGKSSRGVLLKGEAFFDVTKDSDRPFTVNTENTKIEVLGTTFLVKEYKTDVFVYLTEGRINFSENSTNQSLEMTPGMKAKYSNEDGIQQIAFDNLASWKDGLMQFKDQPLANVLSELEIIFETEIELENTELSNCLISAILTADNLELVINQLAGQLGMNAKQNEQGWVLSEGKCN